MVINIVLIVLILLVIAVYLFMRQSSFGKVPSGERLEKIKRSPHYKEGSFQNLSDTPSLTGDISYPRLMKEFFFGKNKRNKPAETLPGKKTDLLALAPDKNVLVWFGHSSYFMQVDGKKILVDPVLSGNASPLKFTTKSYPGSDIYTTDEIPEIDYLFISHDHWDHLDYPTVLALRPKIKTIITGLGTAAHFEHWGFDTNNIIEKDWNEEIVLDKGFIVHTLSARHFSGRSFTRNKALWMSFALTTPTMKIYIGGDSGYDTHFAEIGNEYGPFDLAILECGQYNQYWKYIHMMPEETVEAAINLKAKRLLPVHWAKFSLGLHDWDDPIIRVVKESEHKGMPILHPMIGEEVNLNNPVTPDRWWE